MDKDGESKYTDDMEGQIKETQGAVGKQNIA